MSLQLPPLSLYVHIPWCVRKCPYCDFNSHAQKGDLPEQAYIQCLIADLKEESRLAQGREIQSIFIGGGTPSLFSADSFKWLLTEIDKVIPIQSEAEITLEANPGTFEQDKFRGYRSAGINRLSIGIQSFDAHQLKALGRIHSPDEAIEAATLARELFPKLNLDLMHGLPGQTEAGALQDLNRAIALQPDHLSWYQLTIEPNTEFNVHPPVLPVDEVLWTIQEQGQERLKQAGYTQYEISAYALRESSRAQHNLNYWQFGDYIGIGAGAHGKLTLLHEQQIIRRWKQKQPKAYMQAITRLGGHSPISQKELPFEFMLNVLRLHEGVSVDLLTARTGLTSDQLSAPLSLARQKGLMEVDASWLRPSEKGRLFLNDLLELFID